MKTTNNTYPITTQKEIRRLFWQGNEHLRQYYKPSKRQNDYTTDIRLEWCDFVEMLCRDGHISQTLAQRATL